MVKQLPNSEAVSEYARNRDQLRRKKNLELIPKLKGVWRICVSIVIFGSGIWIISLPMWEITNSNQVEVVGTMLLSPQLVKQYIKIDYPTFFYRLRPQAIATKLEQSLPVKNVAIKRSIFPLQITVIVQERQPIAIASKNGMAGYIDAKGLWIPAHIYSRRFAKPDLVVLGLDDRVLGQWRNLYSELAKSPVKITRLDFRRKDNLILTTELGLVYCGEYTPAKFGRQLQMLDRLRELPKATAKLNFSYIDLVNPEYPVIDGVSPKKLPDIAN